MTSLQRNAVQLAKSLPPRLATFLARYPHPSILPEGADPETAKTGYQQDTPNPFMPTKHPVTGTWHNPVYSLRRQADLVKMAREHGVEELLPPTPKGTLERLRKRVELGLRVKGTGVGQTVKGHKHERQMIAKMEKRREAMLAMPNLIREWKKVGKRNWTKFPK
ncbi:54S ribosomal protein L25, mitochondrial [Coniochaeta pulveracea]|uniref:54S ribosomal protein L25, mitochondrial n=1 Tax=Coniochaeta pulveracea TaxID=177199 RepID=A0A420XY47_9PEZI|nr:54S ribosomal protein L25, mitochondrial [Coniochaeta pulveracea]